MPNQKEWQGLLKLMCSAQNTIQLDALMRLFLTPKEREIIKKRYQIIAMLLKGEHPQRQIAQILGVSISKITAGSKELQQSPDVLLRHLKKHFTQSQS